MPQQAGKRSGKAGNNTSGTAKYIAVGFLLLVILAGVAIVAPRMGGKQGVASAVELPTWLKQYPPEVREAYAYAATHQEALKNMACYCGCQAHGHTDNASCYVKDIDANGRITWDSHAAT